VRGQAIERVFALTLGSPMRSARWKPASSRMWRSSACGAGPIASSVPPQLRRGSKIGHADETVLEEPKARRCSSARSRASGFAGLAIAAHDRRDGIGRWRRHA
jgi:hypothetical protein